ncbi:hypothetical protein [Bacillus ndiopicus]|uniref:hypothetical protein n=1 Tax=Bacillus ndiopicus TaxID=1347368 RepID=UPI0005AAC1C9|nr:hypothetical protein [Bacillus ndiopicus]
MRTILIICFALVLIGCHAESSEIITLDEVMDAFEQHDLELTKTKRSKNSILGTKLNGVKPSAYLLDNKSIYIYTFHSASDVQEALEEFRDKSAPMNLVSFTVYTKDNVLVYYVHAQDLAIINDIDPIIKEALDGL